MKKGVAIRVNKQSYVSIYVGRKWTEVNMVIPTKQFAKQAVRQAYGKNARIVER